MRPCCGTLAPAHFCCSRLPPASISESPPLKLHALTRLVMPLQSRRSRPILARHLESPKQACLEPAFLNRRPAASRAHDQPLHQPRASTRPRRRFLCFKPSSPGCLPLCHAASTRRAPPCRWPPQPQLAPNRRGSALSHRADYGRLRRGLSLSRPHSRRGSSSRHRVAPR